MQELTRRQKEILQYIREKIEGTDLPPTRAEISAAFGFSSPNAAEAHLRVLAKKGAIELLRNSSRGIRLMSGKGIPVIGRVAAGHPMLAQENIEAHYQIDPSLFSPRADYFLKVKGASMKDAGILDGDLLAVHRVNEAMNGQIVVARLENEVTVKRFRRNGNIVELLPENPQFKPIIVDLARIEFAIEGVAVGVIRNGGMP